MVCWATSNRKLSQAKNLTNSTAEKNLICLWHFSETSIFFLAYPPLPIKKQPWPILKHLFLSYQPYQPYKHIFAFASKQLSAHNAGRPHVNCSLCRYVYRRWDGWIKMVLLIAWLQLPYSYIFDTSLQTINSVYFNKWKVPWIKSEDIYLLIAELDNFLWMVGIYMYLVLSQNGYLNSHDQWQSNHLLEDKPEINHFLLVNTHRVFVITTINIYACNNSNNNFSLDTN